MANLNLNIKKASLSDADIISKISVETFIETFAKQNTEQNMDLFLKECFNVEAVKKELLNPEISYFLAYSNNELVGYTKICTAAHADFNTENALEIARIYVLKAYQSKKVGAALMKFIMDYAQINKFEIVWLGVWEFNPKAISFYERWGFEVFGNHIFRLGTDDQNDLLMKKRI